MIFRWKLFSRLIQRNRTKNHVFRSGVRRFQNLLIRRFQRNIIVLKSVLMIRVKNPSFQKRNVWSRHRGRKFLLFRGVRCLRKFMTLRIKILRLLPLNLLTVTVIRNLKI